MNGQPKPRPSGRRIYSEAGTIAALAIWLGFATIAVSAALVAFSKIDANAFQAIALGFSGIVAVATGGRHWTNVQERRSRWEPSNGNASPEPVGRLDDRFTDDER